MVACLVSGCIDTGLDCLPGPEAEDVPALEDNGSIRLDLSFESEIDRSLFRTWGGVILWHKAPLPYLLLNATLLHEGTAVGHARYLLMNVEPCREYGFEISRSKGSPFRGNYMCLLEAIGPEGTIASETRQCLIKSYLEEAEGVAASPPLEKVRARSPLEWPETDEEPQAAQEVVAERSERASPYDGEVAGDGESNDGYDSIDDGGSVPERGEPSSSGASLQDNSSPSSESHLSYSGYESSDYESSADYGSAVSEDLEESPALTGPEGLPAGGTAYVGSKSTKKFHKADCRYASKVSSSNRVEFESLGEALGQGYVPCKVCNPAG